MRVPFNCFGGAFCWIELNKSENNAGVFGLDANVNNGAISFEVFPQVALSSLKDQKGPTSVFKFETNIFWEGRDSRLSYLSLSMNVNGLYYYDYVDKIKFKYPPSQSPFSNALWMWKSTFRQLGWSKSLIVIKFSKNIFPFFYFRQTSGTVQKTNDLVILDILSKANIVIVWN